MPCQPSASAVSDMSVVFHASTCAVATAAATISALTTVRGRRGRDGTGRR